jgi:hypothetical protein
MDESLSPDSKPKKIKDALDKVRKSTKKARPSKEQNLVAGFVKMEDHQVCGDYVSR